MSKRSQRARRTQPPAPEPVPATFDPEGIRRRRRRRWIFLASCLVAAVASELVAYQVRAVTITLENRCDFPLRKIRIAFPGGSIDAEGLEPGATLERVIRPDYTFAPGKFSTYETTIRFGTPDGQLSGHRIPIQSFDYTAREIYTLRPSGPGTPLMLDRRTETGFPIRQIRAGLRRLGLG